MIDIKGKWALVTGASRGIGYLAAEFLAKEGCNLVLASRDSTHCDKILQKAKAYGVEAYAVSVALEDPESVKAMCQTIDDKGTQIDIILNNAGLQVGYRSDYLNTPYADFDTSFRINTTAPMMIVYHFLPGMIERGFGRIINTTSGIDLQPEQAGYSASKAALNKVTRDLGFKLEGSDVMISLTDPGWCRTDLGGPQAPNDPASALPGVVVGVFLEDYHSGRLFAAQDYSGLSLNDAVAKAESVKGVY